MIFVIFLNNVLMRSIKLKDVERAIEDLGLDDDLDKEGVDKVLNHLKVSYRSGIEEVFDKYKTGDDKAPFLNVEGFTNFVTRELKEEGENLKKTMDRFKCADDPDDIPDSNRESRLNLESFNNFISSDFNKLFEPKLEKQYDELKLPINEYFIDSSHNTYLLGNQLTGVAHPNAYSNSLVRGCRCVELDCWDGPDGDPIVTHGGTMVTKILFKDCIEKINENAFITSNYPVILSLELHTSTEQQDRMADIMQHIFNERMEIFQEMREYSPHDMMHRILIKSKRIEPTEKKEEMILTAEEDDDDEDIDYDNVSNLHASQKVELKKQKENKKKSSKTSFITTARSTSSCPCH